MHGVAGNRPGIVLEVIPGDRFALRIRRGDVRETRPIARAGDSGFLEVIERADRFPEAAMADKDREAMGVDGVVDNPLEGTRGVVNYVIPIAVAFPSSSVTADPGGRRGAELNAMVDRSNNRT
jgi:hypothetical protein